MDRPVPGEITLPPSKRKTESPPAQPKGRED
jgi:hypothetical protein